MTSRPLRERFNEKWELDVASGCHVWSAGTDISGYGRVFIGGRGSRLTHRVSWELSRGPIPAGLCVLHHCDNPPCVNPDHLFLGTHTDNARDRSNKGRSMRGSSHVDAKLSESDVVKILRSALRNCDLAEHYGVSRPQISRIRHRVDWRHVV